MKNFQQKLAGSIQTIQRACDISQCRLHDMGVDLCRTDIAMTEEFLNITNIYSLFEKMCSEAMTKGMKRCLFRNMCFFACVMKDLLGSSGIYRPSSF